MKRVIKSHFAGEYLAELQKLAEEENVLIYCTDNGRFALCNELSRTFITDVRNLPYKMADRQLVTTNGREVPTYNMRERKDAQVYNYGVNEPALKDTDLQLSNEVEISEEATEPEIMDVKKPLVEKTSGRKKKKSD
jgi:hypothetical protein